MSAATVTAEYPGTLIRQTNRNTGPVCSECERPLAASEPMHLGQRPVYADRFGVVVLCAECLTEGDREDKARRWKVQPCEGCGREIWPLYTDGWSRRRWCSEACRGRARYRNGQRSTERTCARCRAPFTGRADARYCSPRCRQAADRERAEVNAHA